MLTNVTDGSHRDHDVFWHVQEIVWYDAELLARGIEKTRIRHYGFAFEGKQVLIG